MQERTGAIAQFETDEDALLAGYKRKLSPEQHAHVSPPSARRRRSSGLERRND